MFLGHFAVAFGAKAAAPKASLGTLFLAAQFLDLLWPTFLLLGVERVRIEPGATAVTPLVFEHYPITHSLLAVGGWAVAFALLYLLFTRYPRGAIVAAVLVVSHWVLDALVHAPDLPVYPGGPMVGLGLWHSLHGTLALELGLLVCGLGLYLYVTAARDRVGVWALLGLVAFLLMIQAANLFGEAPPSVSAIAWVGQAQWLLVIWGYWIDRHRTARHG